MGFIQEKVEIQNRIETFYLLWIQTTKEYILQTAKERIARQEYQQQQKANKYGAKRRNGNNKC